MNNPYILLNSIKDQEILKKIWEEFIEIIEPHLSLEVIIKYESIDYVTDLFQQDLQKLKRIYSSGMEYASGDGKDKWPNYPAAITELMYLERKLFGIHFEIEDTIGLCRIISKYIPE